MIVFDEESHALLVDTCTFVECRYENGVLEIIGSDGDVLARISKHQMRFGRTKKDIQFADKQWASFATRMVKEFCNARSRPVLNDWHRWACNREILGVGKREFRAKVKKPGKMRQSWETWVVYAKQSLRMRIIRQEFTEWERWADNRVHSGRKRVQWWEKSQRRKPTPYDPVKEKARREKLIALSMLSQSSSDLSDSSTDVRPQGGV